MWAVRVQIIGLPALLLFGTRFFLFNIFRAIQTPFWAIMLHDEAFFLQNIWQYGKNTYLCTRDKQVRQWVKGGDSYVMGGLYLLLALRYERGN